MISLTYGVLPSREAFGAAFDAVCSDTGLFEIRNCRRVGSRDFSATELWTELNEAVREFEESPDSDAATSDDGPRSWASCVLSVLGFEWI